MRGSFFVLVIPLAVTQNKTKGFYTLMSNARYKATPPTIADGDLGEILLDANGRPVVSIGVGNSSHLSVPFTTSTVQAVGTTDVAGYRSVSVQITSQGGSSNVTFQHSDDGVNWLPTILTNNGAGTSQAAMASNTTGAGVIFSGPLVARYFRLNVTGIASGATAGTIEFSTLPAAAIGLTVTNPSGQNVGVAASQSGTWTTQVDGFTAVQANQTATTAIKSGAGQLYGVFVTGGTAGTIVIYDNTSGSGSKILDLGSTNTVGFYPIQSKFTVGLTAVLGGATNVFLYYR